MVQTTEAAIFATESSESKMYYIHKDLLGSYQTITDENGEVATLDGIKQVYSFDPWGRRRNATTWSYEDVPTAFLFDRGFTGHEHLDAFNLINMNGRVYDPQLGMFLSPDPYVQSPESTQNFNRYGYCWNNPLMYTDPSGEIVLGFVRGLFNALFEWDLSEADPTKPGTASNNSWRIWTGYVKSPGFFTQLPQNTLGFIGAHSSILFGNVESVEFYDGATVVKSRYSNLMWGLGGSAITLGNFIIGDNAIEADPDNPLFQHEFGHVLQSRDAKWQYLGQYGIPSLFSRKDDPHDHGEHPVEQDANVRALIYFSEKDPNWNNWDFWCNSIIGYNSNINNHFNDPQNQQILQDLRLSKATWYFPVYFSLRHIKKYRDEQP